MNRRIRNEGLQRVRTLTRGAAALALLGTGAVVFVTAQGAAQAAEARKAALAAERNAANGGSSGLSSPQTAPNGVSPTAGLTPDQQAQILAQQQYLQQVQQQLAQQQQQQQSNQNLPQVPVSGGS